MKNDATGQMPPLSREKASRNTHFLSLLVMSFALAVVLKSPHAGAQPLIGEDICACSPSTFQFQFNFSLTCPPVNIPTGEGVQSTLCIIRPFSDPFVTDLMPVVVSEVDVGEFDQAGETLTNTEIEGPFDTGDTFSYTTSTLEGDVNVTDASMIPRGLQVAINSENANGDVIINTWILTYSNDCEFVPIVEVGESIGWTVIVRCLHNERNIMFNGSFLDTHSFCFLLQSGTSPPRAELCPAVLDSPTMAPGPTAIPSPEPSPSGAVDPPTVSPTEFPVLPEPTSVPVTEPPTADPPTVSPTLSPVMPAPTSVPTSVPVTLPPTADPPTVSPTLSPVTLAPTSVPGTLPPTGDPTTSPPSSGEMVDPPTTAPTLASVTMFPSGPAVTPPPSLRTPLPTQGFTSDTLSPGPTPPGSMSFDFSMSHSMSFVLDSRTTRGLIDEIQELDDWDMEFGRAIPRQD